MPTLVEIGPSNASQGQHRNKDATEQIKNLTLAGSRTIYIYIYIYGSTPSECQIFYLFFYLLVLANLIICVAVYVGLNSVKPLVLLMSHLDHHKVVANHVVNYAYR